MVSAPPRSRGLIDALVTDGEWGDDPRRPEPRSGVDMVVDDFRERITPDELMRETERLEGSFRQFAQAVLPMFVPNRIKWSWPHDAVVDHMEAVSYGQIQNLIINMPPRTLKSSLVSVAWQCWEWTRWPWLRYLFTSYDLDLTSRDNEYARRILKSQWYQDRWGDRFSILKSADAKRLFENDRNGRRLASSVNSRATGEGGDRLVVDDPHDARKTESEADRKNVIDWWTQTMSSRVNTEDAVKIITAQRTHHADVVGHAMAEMLAGGERYELLILPMEYDPRLYTEGADPVPTEEPEPDDEDEDAWDDDEEEGEDRERAPTLADFEEDEEVPYASMLIPRVNGLGFADPRTRAGELLVPEQWGQKFVEKQRRLLGPIKYAAQYQESPTPAEGGQFKDEYWGSYNYNAMYHHGLRAEMIFVDSAFGTEGGDPTGVSVWGTLGGRLFVLAAYELELELPDLIKRLRDIHAKWRVPFMVEKKASGISLIQALRRGSEDGALPALPTMEFIPDGMSKESRAYSVVPYVAGGLVYLPEGADWADDWKRQHKQFPKGEHDDLVDTTAMAITWLAKHTNEIRELMNRPQRAPYGADATFSSGSVGGLTGGARVGKVTDRPYWERR